MKRFAGPAVVTLFLLITGADTSALTPDQCQYFAVNGTTPICHATQSARHPYVLLDTSSEACVAHADHGRDFLALDGACDGAGSCLPVGSPCDETLPCCDGSSCISGTCQEIPIDPTALWPPDMCVAPAQ